MIRRFMILLLVMACCVWPAFAEPVLIDPFADQPAAAMTELLAARLSEMLGRDVPVLHENDETEAVKTFFAQPDGDALLLLTPNALVYSLQGLMPQDLRTEVVPVSGIARSGSLFYVSPETASLIPDLTMDSLASYTEEKPYEIALLRTMDAGYDDSLSIQATGDFYLDEEFYSDYAEMEQALQDGQSGIAVFSSAELPAELQSFVPACDTGIPGVWIGIFVSAESPEGFRDEISACIRAVCESSEWIQYVNELGYTASPCSDPEAFRQLVEDETAMLISYLTTEGLFFYEW